MSKGEDEDHDRKTQRQLTLARGRSGTLDRQLEILFGPDLCHLHIGESCEAWPLCRASSSGMKTCVWCMSWLFGIYS